VLTIIGKPNYLWEQVIKGSQQDN